MFDMGVGTGFALQWPGVQGTSAGATAQGPMTAAEQGFGVQAGGSAGVSSTTTGVLSVGTVAFIGLAILWWSLPR